MKTKVKQKENAKTSYRRKSEREREGKKRRNCNNYIHWYLLPIRFKHKKFKIERKSNSIRGQEKVIFAKRRCK